MMSKEKNDCENIFLFDNDSLVVMSSCNYSYWTWTDVRLSHIRKHDGDTHTPDVCKDIKFSLFPYFIRKK